MYKPNVKIRYMELSHIADDSEKANRINKSARRDGLGERNLLYMGFEGNKHSTLFRYGTLNPESEFLCASEEVNGNECGNPTTPLSYALERDRPAMAIYDKSRFDRKGPNNYRFKEPGKKLDALLAVYFLKR